MADRKSERLKIDLETGGAAFDDSPAFELARILRRLADTIESGGRFEGRLHDLNGNHCGDFSIKPVRRRH